MYEELYGLSACTENVEYSLHCQMTLYATQLSTITGAICMNFRCIITNARRQTTSPSATYTDRAQQLCFINAYLQANSSICESSKYTLDQISEPPVLLCAKTASDAVELS